MVDVSSRVCLHEGCRKNPSFNFVGTKKGMYCSGHRLDGMIDVKTRQCSHDGCNIFPTFNFEGCKPGKFCSKHKMLGMKDVRSKVELPCRFEGCSARPIYNFPGMKGSRYCAKHKTDGMECTVKRCKHQGCDRAPTYNFEDDTVPLFCSHHKIEGMVYLSNRRKCQCEQDRCTKYPRYNHANVFDERGKLWGRFCEDHKLEDMICVIKVCRFEKCERSATHSFLDDMEPLYCGEHKVEGMVINNCKPAKTCSRVGCTAYPAYFSVQDATVTAGVPASAVNGYCCAHKTDDMVLRRRVCDAGGCSRHPSFNYPGERKRRFCATHKETGMVAVSRSKPSQSADENSCDEDEDSNRIIIIDRKRRISEVNGGVIVPERNIVLTDEMSFSSDQAPKPKSLVGGDHIPLASALLMAVNMGNMGGSSPGLPAPVKAPAPIMPASKPSNTVIAEISKDEASTFLNWVSTADSNKSDSVSV
jgi:hypothetical protein